MLGRCSPFLPTLLMLAWQRVSTDGVDWEQCSNVDGAAGCGATIRPLAPSPKWAVRPARGVPALSEFLGLDEAKAVLNEGVVLPLSMDPAVARLFWRSNEHSAVLLVGPPGLGKVAAAEAAVAAGGGRVLPLLATEVALSSFCSGAVAAAQQGPPVVILVEDLETAPMAAMSIRRCLREAAAGGQETGARVLAVATMGKDLNFLAASERALFGYIVQLPFPDETQRKQFVQRLLQQISRVDAQWGSALREAAFATLANLTSNYTFAEIELVVRRAFLRSLSAGGVRDPVALHHFEQVLADSPPRAAAAFQEALRIPSDTVDAAEVAPRERRKRGTENDKKKQKKDSKDPMDGIFGWCNMLLPEILHLPPVVWAMILFGILAHFMARSAYQPRRAGRRGGAGTRSSLSGDVTGGGSSQFASFGDNVGDWYPGAGAPGMPFGMLPGGAARAATRGAGDPLAANSGEAAPGQGLAGGSGPSSGGRSLGSSAAAGCQWSSAAAAPEATSGAAGGEAGSH